MLPEKRRPLSRIPGFRSGVLWKKVLASIFYVFILLVIIALLSPNSSNPKPSGDNKVIDELQSKIATLETTIDNLKTENEKLKKDIEQISSKTDTKEQEKEQKDIKEAAEEPDKKLDSDAGHGFFYKNVKFKSSFGMMDVIGEMTNTSKNNYTIANFVISIYSTSGELLDTGNIIISNIGSGQTKSFDGIFTTVPGGQFKYKIQFENGL